MSSPNHNTSSESIIKQPSSQVIKPLITDEEKNEIDGRSIFVGNVDYSSTAKSLENHFKDCGVINRITIPKDKYTSRPKGFAYIEFKEEESVNNARKLNDSKFNYRNIQVMSKRTNIVGISSSNRLPASRGRGQITRGRGPVRRGRGRLIGEKQNKYRCAPY